MSTEFLGPDDVVSSDENVPGLNRPTFKVEEVLDSFRQKLSANSPFFTEGVDCRVLRPGGNWRNGKVRVSLEFIPDDNQ